MNDIRDLIRDLTVYGPEVESLRGDDGFAFDESLPKYTPLCPACESGDHEGSWLTEPDYQCECSCHEGRRVRQAQAYESEQLTLGLERAKIAPVDWESACTPKARRNSLQRLRRAKKEGK